MKKRYGVFVIALLLLFGFNGNAVVAEGNQLQEEIIYGILVDRFNNGNYENDKRVEIENPAAYHGGDFQGIIDRLDGLKEIGITTITLSPLMQNAEGGYHGYWVEDFKAMEERFGTIEELNTLIEEAHQRDIKVLMELVTNYAAKSNPIVTDPSNEDWINTMDITEPEWTSNVVQLNLENPEVKEYIINAAEFWVEETDLDGLKLHAVDQTPLSFLQQLTQSLKETDSELYLLGDILVTDENNEEIIAETEIDAIENVALYEAMTEVFSEPTAHVSKVYETWEQTQQNLDLLFLDDMDTERFTQQFSGNGRNAVTSWTLALTYMYTSPGVPVLFQGSEFAMYGRNAEESQRLVQFNSGEPELQEFFSRIASLRSEFPALQHGDFEIVGSNGAMSVFKRTYDGETMFIAINNDSESKYIDVSDIEPGMQLRGFLGDNIVRENENGTYRVGVPRESVEVYALQPDVGLNWGLISLSGGIILLFIFGVSYLSFKQKRREAQKIS
ncbi:alpha-amlyase [Oceanobacillus piezotolerans]|uniref:Alpha-amlyase n=1 Tax=Oceanobacillus piezotolerans TaxID=2448030 RepID=A0A498DHR9_9BACI|nr:alpha-amylase family glycosyl hydrolase [Oceanobacillus piezotolerans]RLL45045.1 alpha-amlyase [Oceanobacillus piezotolerans]